MATYDDLVKNLKLQWVDTEDVLATQRAIIEVTPGGAYMELPRGLRGEKGEKGDPGAAPMFRHLVTSYADLPKNLTQYDQGAAFPDVGSRSLWVWTGSDYFEVPNFIGVAGETGKTPELAVGDVTLGGEARFSVNQAVSTPERVVFDVQLPQGPQGPTGPPGPVSESSNIVEAPDFDSSVAPRVGDAIVWNGSKWQASQSNVPIGPWVMGESNFVRQSVSQSESGSVRERLIGTLNIPALPYDYRPLVIGGQLFFRTSAGIRYDVDVRLANASTGVQIGSARGYLGQKLGDPSIIVPFSSQGIVPGGANTVIPANTSTSIYVVARKTLDGNVGSWEFSPVGSAMAVIAMPVVI